MVTNVSAKNMWHQNYLSISDWQCPNPCVFFSLSSKPLNVVNLSLFLTLYYSFNKMLCFILALFPFGGRKALRSMNNSLIWEMGHTGRFSLITSVCFDSWARKGPAMAVKTELFSVMWKLHWGNRGPHLQDRLSCKATNTDCVKSWEPLFWVHKAILIYCSSSGTVWLCTLSA